MLTLLRHLLAILLLPFLVLVVVPSWLLTAWASYDSRWGDGSPFGGLARMIGGIFIVAGFGLFSWCVTLFVRVGRGTLAPWDPTQNLVAAGPYRFVRNPMISGVAMMLVGQALFWGSWIVGLWSGVFILVNHVYFVLSEEPGLEARFGEAYRRYKGEVPRWVPRIR